MKKVPSATAAGYADYLQGKAIASSLGDYYLKDGERVEAPGRWVQGATAVGADPQRPVDAAVLRELMAVRHPLTGGPLRQAGASGQQVAALDAAFSAPKSVSAIWALADQDLRARIELAHETAIDRALAYATRQVPLARRRVDRQTVTPIRVVALVASSWRHTTARAVDGQPPDPQLHSHVLIHAGLRGDGKLVAIDSRALLTHRRELGAAYRTELARELTGLGFAVARGSGQGGRYFEIAGVPQLLLDVWSSRHRQVQAAIRQRLERTGRHNLTAAEERFMAVSTRAGKQPATSRELDRHWQATANHHRFGTREQAALRDSPQPATPTAVDVEVVVGALTEFDATFTRTQARAVAMEQNAGVPIRDAINQLAYMREHGQLLTLANGTLTTRRHRQWETQTVASLNLTAHQRVTPLPTEIVTAEAQRLDARLSERGGRLTDEQLDALGLASGDRQLVVIEGQAGSGKSTVLQAVARAHQQWGQQLIITSTSALAAERLDQELSQAGVIALAFSTAALEQAIANDRVELTADHTIIHDEAALASTRELRPLLAHVQESGARLILVGDPHQNQPVGAGGLWPYIEQTSHGSGAHVALTNNVRARDPLDRRDQALFRDGEHEQALHGYAERGHLYIHGEQESAEDAALEAAHADRDQGLRTIVIAQTSNEHLDELNARVQAIRLQNRELGRHGLAVPGRPYELHPGDEVQVRNTTETTDAGWVRNGTTGIVAQTDPATNTTRLALSDKREVLLSQEQLAQADIRLAYVQHPFPAQGVTTDTTHLIAAEHASGPGSYVALTRARQHTDIHTSREVLEDGSERDTISRLAQRLGAQEPQIASIQQPIATPLQEVRREPPTSTEPDRHEAPEVRQEPRPRAEGDREPLTGDRKEQTPQLEQEGLTWEM